MTTVCHSFPVIDNKLLSAHAAAAAAITVRPASAEDFPPTPIVYWLRGVLMHPPTGELLGYFLVAMGLFYRKKHVNIEITGSRVTYFKHF